jgi:serine/threonine protein kinase/Flp pilus assembly protein TadD
MATPQSDHSEEAGRSLLDSVDGGSVSLGTPGSLGTRQVEELVAAWRRGERLRAEDLLARHPELGDEAAIRLIYEEACLRLEAGLPVDPAEVARRFPRWRDELEVLLDCQVRLQPGAADAAFPEVGEVLAGYRIAAELGRGATGRVYLASQPTLADRPVVLKVAPRGLEEHLSLARLQHMNIVPIYSEHVLQARNLQILCMPFLGGATLALVLDRLRDRPPDRRTGRQLVDALDAIQAGLPIPVAAQGPMRAYLARSTYVAAICSIGACLADGLQYAHDRDLVHMDVKPSNVLFADDGQPMLLDFHLARPPITPGGPAPLRMGGTPDYMSPEQRLVVEAVRAGRPVTVRVDGRSDIYSFGLLLHEALGGDPPDAGKVSQPPLHRRNPQVSLGLSDIVRRCLRPDPRERYQDAAALAADLRRHVADLPLRGVPNRSPMERWRKWRRRTPHALSRNLILAAFLAATFCVGASLFALYRQRVRDLEAALGDGRSYLDRRQYPEAVRTLRRGLLLAELLPGVGRQRGELGRDLAWASWKEKAVELHRLAESIRLRYGLALPPAEEAQVLIRKGREIWQARDRLAPPPGTPVDPETERDVRIDMIDVLTLWADLRGRLAPPEEAEAVRREISRVLAEAEESLGPSPALEHARREQRGGRAGTIDDQAAAPSPSSAWDFYDLGRRHLRAGELDLADRQFRAGLELRPQDFWLNFYHGLCAYRQKDFGEAVHAFHVCIALSPGTAECFYNRALADESLGHDREALMDYTRALDLNPALTAAALNRGGLLYRLGRYDEASSVLLRARDSASRESAAEIDYNLALVDLARGDRSGAVHRLRSASALGHEPARALRERLSHER